VFPSLHVIDAQRKKNHDGLTSFEMKHGIGYKYEKIKDATFIPYG